METLSERLKHLIESNHLTINKLASDLNYTPHTFWNILNGKTENPRMDVLQKVCSYFNVSADWLLLGKGEPSPSPTAPDDVVLLLKENENLKERIAILEQRIQKNNSPKKANAALEYSPKQGDTKKGNKKAQKCRTNVAQGIFTIGLSI